SCINRTYLLLVKNVMIVLLMLLSEIARSQVSGPNLPHIKSIDAECNSKVLVVVISKGIRCGTLSIDGSEFTITPLFGSIATTSANSCVFGTEIDTVWITLSDPQPAGNYKLTIKNGTDSNTLVDLEGNQIPDGESFDFTVFPPMPTPMDSLAPFDCGTNMLQLIFPDLISCNSISPDGSDFQISGTTNAHIIKAEGSCDNQFTQVIHLTLDSPLVKTGNYQITLVRGSDLNALINQCGTETPPGASLSFQTLDTVSALFSYDIVYGCLKDTIQLYYLPAGAISWQWIVDSSFTSNSLNPFIIENKFGPRYVQHIVSNGSCSDTVTEVVNLDNSLKAAFQAPAEICPKDLVTFQNASIGNIESWYWNFGDGSSSTLETPEAHRFPDSGNDAIYSVRLIVQNNLGCSDTSVALIKKMQSCYITVPNAFTPNGDGKNDYLYPLNAFNAVALDFRVYNRLGQIVFETRDWTKKWDGTINGHPQTTGTYVWLLTYTDGLSGKKISQQGTSVLIR
ncbi:MAG TPA: gliding motility-associated C-terminal domain-containing protein, partial [Puia sp.]